MLARAHGNRGLPARVPIRLSRHHFGNIYTDRLQTPLHRNPPSPPPPSNPPFLPAARPPPLHTIHPAAYHSPAGAADPSTTSKTILSAIGFLLHKARYTPGRCHLPPRPAVCPRRTVPRHSRDVSSDSFRAHTEITPPRFLQL